MAQPEQQVTPKAGSFLTPASFIRAAQAADPSFKYAILAAGLLAIVVTFAKFGVGYAALVFGSISLIGLMVLFLVFAQASKLSRSTLDPAAKVLVWSMLLIAIAIVLFLTGSVFFNRPLPFRNWIIEQLTHKQAAADAQKQIADLKDQNKTLLVQVDGEPIGNTITIRYTIMIPLAQQGLQGIEDQLRNQMRQLTSASPISSSSDTYVVHVSQPSQPDRYLVTFNNKSPLMPSNEYQRSYLSEPPFGASLYLKPPPPLPLGGCGNLPPKADIELAWNGTATAERTPDNFSDGVRWKGVTLSYSTTNNYLEQSAEGIFYIRSNNARVVKIVALSQAYVRLFSHTQRKIEFKDLTVIIGQHSFALPQEQLVSDECGVIIYRLPTIAPTS